MNISKKVKWGLIGCGFLGANGLVIPAVSSNFPLSALSAGDLSMGGGYSQFD